MPGCRGVVVVEVEGAVKPDGADCAALGAVSHAGGWVCRSK